MSTDRVMLPGISIILACVDMFIFLNKSPLHLCTYLSIPETTSNKKFGIDYTGSRAHFAFILKACTHIIYIFASNRICSTIADGYERAYEAPGLFFYFFWLKYKAELKYAS